MRKFLSIKVFGITLKNYACLYLLILVSLLFIYCMACTDGGTMLTLWGMALGIMNSITIPINLLVLLFTHKAKKKKEIRFIVFSLLYFASLIIALFALFPYIF